VSSAAFTGHDSRTGPEEKKKRLGRWGQNSNRNREGGSEREVKRTAVAPQIEKRKTWKKKELQVSLGKIRSDRTAAPTEGLLDVKSARPQKKGREKKRHG